MTVVTLHSQTPFAPNMSMEAFATGLFNHWGVGNAQRNDGIMVLVLPNDRAMRIELGAGYGQDWNGHAARIVQRDFLPAFRQDAYTRGIMIGSASTIQEIAIPFSEGATHASAARHRHHSRRQRICRFRGHSAVFPADTGPAHPPAHLSEMRAKGNAPRDTPHHDDGDQINAGPKGKDDLLHQLRL